MGAICALSYLCILHFHFHFSVFKSHCVWSCCNSTFVTFLMVRRLTLKLVRVRRDISVNGSSGWKSAEAFFFGARAKRATHTNRLHGFTLGKPTSDILYIFRIVMTSGFQNYVQ